jgi:SNF2 family DNA or RNA helicase
MTQDRCANLSDPGTGKTPPTCVYLAHIWQDYGYRTMFVMPKSLLKKNKDEILKFTWLTEDDVVIYDGTPKQREKIRKNSNAKIWLMGFRRFADEWADLKRLHPSFNMICVDEIHMGFGGWESNQTKQLKRALGDLRGQHYIRKFIALTGTLIDGRLDTAYPTIHIIDPWYYGSLEAFKAIHAIEDFDGTVVAWKNHERLAQILGRHTIKRTFAETYGENEIISHTEMVPMAKRQREVYKEWEDAGLVELEDRFMSTEGVEAVHSIRCRQIMAHPEEVDLPVEYDEDGHPIRWETYNLLGKTERTGKDEALLVHLADHKNSGSPFIIFGTFQREVDRIAQLCRDQGFRVGKIHGGVSGKRRSDIDEAFQAGELDCVVATAATASVGFNWGHVDHVIFASLDYKDSNFIQARRRAERGTRETPLRVTILMYENAAVEDRVFEIVEKKSLDAHKVDPTVEKLNLRPNVKRRKPKPAPPSGVPSLEDF